MCDFVQCDRIVESAFFREYQLDHRSLNAQRSENSRSIWLGQSHKIFQTLPSFLMETLPFSPKPGSFARDIEKVSGEIE